MTESRLSDPAKRVIAHLLLGVFVAAVFLANACHFGQQGTFFAWYLPLARTLAQTHAYDYTPYEPDVSTFPAYIREEMRQVRDQGRSWKMAERVEPATYPLWGYPALLALLIRLGLDPTLWIHVLQGVLCLVAILLAYRAMQPRLRLWHLPFLYPWITLFAVRWPDAVVLFLLTLVVAVVAARAPRAGAGPDWLLIGGTAIALAATFHLRSEYLLLPVVLAAVVALLGRLGRLARPGRVLRDLALAILAAWLLYIPWVVHASGDGRLRLTATNAGGVLYITLGQLPGNPWQRSHFDAEAHAYARERGIGNPWSSEGDRVLKQAFRADVARHPTAFARKVVHNLRSTLWIDMYLGEYLDLCLPAEGGVGVQALRYFRKAGVIANDRVLRHAFKLGHLVALVALVATLLRLARVRHLGEGARIALALFAGTLAYKIVVCALVQFEPRHVQMMWVPLFLNVACFVSCRFGRGATVGTR